MHSRSRPATAWSLAALIFVLITTLVGVCDALKFDLQATNPGTRRCVAQFISDKQMVVGTVSAADGERMKVDIEVFDTSVHNNKHWHKLNIVNEQKFAFTAHDDAEVFYCFTNTLDTGVQPGANMKRTITLHIDTGAEAADLSEEIKNKKLRPLEIELTRLEAILSEVTAEMDELKTREMAMRDVNESTNSRVKWFNTFTIIVLLGSGAYQIAYLRRFFQAKKLI
ncbi:vesicle coat component [Geranomyces variabilis]|nr:vesicle coat component [Geranomyces variabilis]